MFASIGLNRTDGFYITNMIFWRPPGNRNPTPEELAICKPFVERHIALVNPALLVFVGGIAAIEMLQPPAKVGITKLRGHLQKYHSDALGKDIPALAMLHPSYLLRQPAQKKLAWQDMLLLETLLCKRQTV
jgi:uracil-DNA glycosylase